MASGVVPSLGVRSRSGALWVIPSRVVCLWWLGWVSRLTVFEFVVFGAGLAEVRDAGGAAVGPGQKMVRFVV